MLPAPMTGVFETVNVLLQIPTLVTEPPPFPPVPVLLITSAPLPLGDPSRLVIVTFSPATSFVTPELVTITPFPELVT